MFVRLFLPIGALALLASGSVSAATAINQTRPLNADGQVSVENVKDGLSCAPGRKRR